MTTAITTNVPLPSKLRKLAERRLKLRVESRRKDCESTIASYLDYIKDQTEKLKKVEEEVQKEVAQWVEATVLLKKARIKASNPYGLFIEVETTQKKLTAVYKAIGKLDPSRLSK